MTGVARRAAGLTLLELIVSLAILGMVMSGVALLWSQARGWEEEQQSHRSGLRAERVLGVMREQWAGRRVLGDAAEEGLGVEVLPGSITFVSARGVLFEGWPLVRVRYSIERDVFGSAGGAGWSLVLEEARVVDPLELPEFEGAGFDRLGNVMTARTVLLEGVDELVFERFGTLAGPPCADEVLAAEEDASEEEEGAGEDDDAAGDADPLGVFARDEEDCAERWRLFEDVIAEQPRAVRLVGVKGEEVIVCVFELAALR